jgi:hypothetical protein
MLKSPRNLKILAITLIVVAACSFANAVLWIWGTISLGLSYDTINRLLQGGL